MTSQQNQQILVSLVAQVLELPIDHQDYNSMFLASQISNKTKEFTPKKKNLTFLCRKPNLN
jgi:hypothetical protein